MLKPVELLAPAGSKEALIAAVSNGCDAIYLGGSAFGARAFAENFHDEEMAEAIAYAHRYGVKVYVTVNTLIKDQEMDDCIAYIGTLQDMDVDALIIQDLGLLDVIHQTYPDLELHASTQMHIHNQAGLLFLKAMGIQRAVLARETTIQQIQALSSLGIDLEVFVHGALCVSYSGQCLMSYRLFDRSGNRGACAQPCRMAYRLSHRMNDKLEHVKLDDEYLLSLKDLNTLNHIPELMDAGITSFKIEGRMKSPEYVAQTVKAYRKAIDAHIQKQAYHYDVETEKNLQKVFHRGFSAGHLFEANNQALVNMKRPNHMGIPIGKVIKTTKDRVRILLSDEIRQGDGIRIIQDPKDYGCMVNRIYDIHDKLIHRAGANDIIELDKTGFIVNHSMVIKSVDKQLMEDIERELHDHKRKVMASMQFCLQIGKPARLIIRDEDNHEVLIQSEELVEEAKHVAIDEARIQQQLMKTGDTIFQVNTICVDQEPNSTLSIKSLNAMRREGLSQLTTMREVNYHNRRIASYKRVPSVKAELPTLSIIITTKEQLQAVKSLNETHIYTTNLALYKQNPELHYIHPKVHHEDYEPQINDAISEVGGLYQHQSVVSELSLNVTNSYTVAFLHVQGVSNIMLSPELSSQEVKTLVDEYHKRYGDFANLTLMAYGRLELMTTRYCVISAALSNGKRNCGKCRGEGYYQLNDRKGKNFPLLCDTACYMHILDDEPLNKLGEIPTYLKNGIRNIRLHFTIEDQKTTQAIIQQYQEVLKAYQ